MGGRSNSETTTTTQAFDNRTLNQFTDNSDRSAREETNIDIERRIELGERAIQAGGNVYVEDLSGDVVSDSLKFAEVVATEGFDAIDAFIEEQSKQTTELVGEAFRVSQESLSSAFSNTQGELIDAKNDIAKIAIFAAAAVAAFALAPKVFK